MTKACDFFGMPATIKVDEMVVEICLRFLREFGLQPSRIALPNKLYKYALDCAMQDSRWQWQKDIKLSLDIHTPAGPVTLVPDDESKFIDQYLGGS